MSTLDAITEQLTASSEAEWSEKPAHQRNAERKARVKRDLFALYVEGASVLHLGAGGGTVGRPDDDTEWFHAWLDDAASECVGLDVDEGAVHAAQAQGFDVRQGDAQSFALDEMFDVVAAPNVIEHVGNPRGLLASAREHLAPGGVVLVTTDRITIPWWTLQALRNRGAPGTHPDHVAAFTRGHLRRLCRRTGLGVVEYQSWGFEREGMSLADSAWRLVERGLARMWPEIEHVQHFLAAEKQDRECPECGCRSVEPDRYASGWYCRTCHGVF